jgi:hypothetical protein
LPAFQSPVSAGGTGNAGTPSGVNIGSTGNFSAPPTPSLTLILTPPRINNANQVIRDTSPSSIVVLIIQGGSGAAPAGAQLQSTFLSFGVSPVSVQALITALRALFFGNRADASPVVPNLNASLLKSFDSKDLLLAQGETGSINPVALAAAINAYNEIIDTSSPEALGKLSKDNDFIEVGQTLRKLRSALTD